MKNICFFNSTVFWGGGEKLHLESALGFRKKKYHVFLLANPRSILSIEAKEHGLRTFPVRAGNLSFLNPFKILRLFLFFKNQQMDTVIFTTSQDLKLGSVSAKWAGVKTIVYLRGLAVPIGGGVINRIIFKYFLTHIIANSEETKRGILKHLGKYLKADKVKVIYHGIPASGLNPHHPDKNREILEKGHGIILGNAGRLTPQKGQESLLKVAGKLKQLKIDFTLFLAGTGELRAKLELLRDKYDLKNDVFFLGHVDDMEGFMSSIDIFLLTSAWEGFGFVLVEAMAKAKPVVAFNISSNPEIVIENETGFLVNYPDLEMFTEKTLLLMEDETLRKEMGIRGVNRVRDHFVIDDRISELESYISSQ